MSDEEEKKPLEAARGDSTESDTSEVLEFEFNDDGEEDLKKTLKKFRADLKMCQKEKEEFLLGWQKERADFANYRKQEDDRKLMFSESMRERILAKFLTVMDSFNMAFANRTSWEKVDENWRKGVEYIFGQMNNIFEEYGVKEIGEVGDIFDPNMHESIELVLTDIKELNHTVSQVIQKGYKLGLRILRPVKVNVYEFKE
ncbi:MAG: nucleotide exchange factor GrpE [Patescibacteria group bacterium]